MGKRILSLGKQNIQGYNKLDSSWNFSLYRMCWKSLYKFSILSPKIHSIALKMT